MTSGATIGALADELADILLRGDPFAASFMAISGYDDAVPDLSPEYQRAWRGLLTDIARAEQAAIQWYFARRRDTAVPDDLAGYARSCGFPDEQAFRAAVRREHWYVRPD